VAYTNSWGKNSHPRVLEICLKLKANISDLGEVVDKSLDAFINYWQSGDVASLQEFRPFWGRGTQYISFIKNCAPETSK
jgi:hypothetical protein